jgi:6,7-dimethyl-8-ribityllumazine synthase
MLKRIPAGTARKTGGRFAIVASCYNRRYVDALLRAAGRELRRGGADSIEVVRVPGAFEIPVVAAKLARERLPRLSAILCLGVILQGETSHARHIGDAVSHALAQLQIECRLPVIHGVYLFENEEQARVRCLGRTHNRGLEVARTALQMARVIARLG